jgi:hypothetical protein
MSTSEPGDHKPWLGDTSNASVPAVMELVHFTSFMYPARGRMDLPDGGSVIRSFPDCPNNCPDTDRNITALAILIKDRPTRRIHQHPHLFLTLFAADLHWDNLMRHMPDYEGWESATSAERIRIARVNLRDNPHIAAYWFDLVIRPSNAWSYVRSSRLLTSGIAMNGRVGDRHMITASTGWKPKGGNVHGPEDKSKILPSGEEHFRECWRERIARVTTTCHMHRRTAKSGL